MVKNQQQAMAGLAEKYLAGTATPQEQEILHNWYNQWQDDEEEVVCANLTAESLRLLILGRIKSGMKEPAQLTPFYRKKWFWHTAAASVLFFSVLSYFLLTPPLLPKKETISGTLAPAAKNKIVPGYDKAILKLADGKIVELDSTGVGVLAQQGNTSIINKNGKIIYDATYATNGEILYNTISTPRGGQYQLVLPDGTKVWLNASSSIKFPVAFAADERVIELTGEAYFEVTKDATKPFTAKVNEVEVRVLGTHFNIMAYAEEGKIATTLLEGSVNIKKAAEQHLIKPGQMAVFNQSGRFNLNDDVDVEEIISWKNGKFHFYNADIKTIMRQISRWYDVDVEYEGPVFEDKLAGIVSKKEDIMFLLKSFEKAGELKFKITGKKIIVTK